LLGVGASAVCLQMRMEGKEATDGVEGRQRRVNKALACACPRMGKKGAPL
jgi:hypothetical protein